MRKDIHKKGEPKARYRVRNWAAYNEGLINRGNVTIWIDEALLHKSNVRTPWHRTGIIQAIRTDCGPRSSAIRSYRLESSRRC
ncbi:MAG: hypothetical protein E5299_00288 [Burkholderia gladioli]|nr:MAG: hypothetical protein E5299_00288 [Burkholderia gladioli]